MSGDAKTDKSIEVLIDEFATRFRRGERPAIDEYTRKYPQLAEEIRDVFPALQMVEELAVPDSQPTPTASIDAATRIAMPSRLGEFRIVREIGRGGMGVVYEAIQEPLDRQVALKILPGHALQDDIHRQRFLREAQAAAKLHHTNIVPVFAVGEQDGLPYFAMQYIRGQGLHEVIGELRRWQTGEVGESTDDAPERAALMSSCIASLFATRASGDATDTPDLHLTKKSKTQTTANTNGLHHDQTHFFRSVAQIGIQAAEALAYAHQHSILHRDIKPSNLMLDTDGVVWVMDFGLAKQASLNRQGEENLTQTGDIVGTLRYLAPERFAGNTDTRSDIYSLGLTLYEMLALQPAFDEADRNQLLLKVMHEEPTGLQSVNASVPRDLATIVHKCIQREPGRRYETAQALSDDLRRFLNGEPILARRITPAERLWMWVRRHPIPTALAAMTVVAVVSAAAFLVYFNLNQRLRTSLTGEEVARKKAEDLQEKEAKARKNEKQARIREEQARQRAESAEELASRSRFNVATLLAHKEWEQGNVPVARQLHASVPREFRHWEWHFLQRLLHQESQVFRGKHGLVVTKLALSHDGKRLAWVSGSDRLKVVETNSGNIFFEQHFKPPVRSLALASDGSHFAVSRIGALAVWDLNSGHVVRNLNPAARAEDCMAFSPDGKRLALGASRSVWDVETGKRVLKLERAPGRLLRISGLKYDPKGNWIAGRSIKKVYLWQAKTGKLVAELQGHPREIVAMAFTISAADYLLTACTQEVRSWNCRQGKMTYKYPGAKRNFGQLALTPPKSRRPGYLAVVEGKTISVRSLTRGKEVMSFRGASQPFFKVAFSGDGNFLAAGAVNNTVRVFAVNRKSPSLLFHTGGGHRKMLVFHPRDDRLVSTAINNSLVVRNTSTTAVIEQIALPGPPGCIAYSPDGEWLACCISQKDKSSKIVLRNEKTKQSNVWTISKRVNWLSFNRSSNLLAASTSAATRLWDIDRGKEISTIKFGPKAVFRSDGKLLIHSAKDGIVRIWNAQLAKEEEQISAAFGITASSADGRLLAISAINEDAIQLWDAVERRLRFKLVGHSFRATVLAFHPNGDRLLTTGLDATINIWDTVTGQLVLSLRDPRRNEPIVNIAVSADGRRFATINDEGEVRIYASHE